MCVHRFSFYLLTRSRTICIAQLSCKLISSSARSCSNYRVTPLTTESKCNWWNRGILSAPVSRTPIPILFALYSSCSCKCFDIFSHHLTGIESQFFCTFIPLEIIASPLSLSLLKAYDFRIRLHDCFTLKPAVILNSFHTLSLIEYWCAAVCYRICRAQHSHR